ncbi:MAG: RNA pyrophosphohydrolase [Alphaproteobacteria bacterium MarineAlpha5_Bin9]|nr:MAG: RNA pyrophosphohydrolase [Alphaproteobacteria bacterium MarineAlpha5_Bin9]|tara:strand:- start:22784 stop:23242 length:459 start_codon:yes stop_codon:yes gene_type:complete
MSELRKCVGIMLINSKKQIFVGKRIDHPSGFWQMPQGGIDNTENAEQAVWREMMEEIGTNKASIIKISKKWINYKIPKETLKTLPWGKKYIGQTQKWFAFNFDGEEKDINIKTKNPEFSDWKWSDYKDIIDEIVPFKKKTYSIVIEEFRDLF